MASGVSDVSHSELNQGGAIMELDEGDDDMVMTRAEAQIAWRLAFSHIRMQLSVVKAFREAHIDKLNQSRPLSSQAKRQAFLTPNDHASRRARSRPTTPSSSAAEFDACFALHLA
jgi:hypothetical protein